MIPAAGAALLFDIDGTLADTDPLHLVAFNQAFAPYGYHFDADGYAAKVQGLANADIARRLLPDLSFEDAMDVLDRKEATFRDLARTALHPVSGLLALLDLADAAGIPIGTVTNAPRANADLIIDGLGLRQRFKALVIGSELSHGKPHPMPYLEGLRLLGARAACSVAFEDSRTGIASAVAAGLATVGIRTSLGHDALLAAGATTSAASYSEPALLDFISRRVAST